MVWMQSQCGASCHGAGAGDPVWVLVTCMCAGCHGADAGCYSAGTSDPCVCLQARQGRGAGAMAGGGAGLPKRLGTLLSGLLECGAFCGLIFGWASLVFVLKDLQYFKEWCQPTGHNGTELLGTAPTAPCWSACVLGCLCPGCHMSLMHCGAPGSRCPNPWVPTLPCPALPCPHIPVVLLSVLGVMHISSLSPFSCPIHCPDAPWVPHVPAIPMPCSSLSSHYPSAHVPTVLMSCGAPCPQCPHCLGCPMSPWLCPHCPYALGCPVSPCPCPH